LPWGPTPRPLLSGVVGAPRLWQVQCDSIGQYTAGRWVELSDGGLQLPAWNGQPVFRTGDAGTLVAAPPLFVLGPSPSETWLQGAVCSLCPLDGGVQVVPCADPDGGA